MKGLTVEMLSRRVVKRAVYSSAEAAVEVVVVVAVLAVLMVLEAEGEERSWWKDHVWVKGAGRSFPRTAWKGRRALRGLEVVVEEGEEDAESDSEIEGRPFTCRLGAVGVLLLLFRVEEEDEDAILARLISTMTERKGRPAAPF